MKRCVVATVAAVLMTAGPMALAPPAGAGCHYGGAFISKCDGPIQPDGTWERCVGVPRVVHSGFSTHLVPVKQCGLMGGGQHHADLAFADPPTHIPG